MKYLYILIVLFSSAGYAADYTHDIPSSANSISLVGNEYLALCAKSEIHPSHMTQGWQGGLGACTDMHSGAYSFGLAKKLPGDDSPLVNLTITPVDSEEREVFIGGGINWQF